MWNLKYTVKNLDTSYAILTTKYKVTDYFYPLDYYVKNNRIHILGIHILEGPQEEQKKFIDAIKKDKKTMNIEVNKNQLVILIAEEESIYKALFSPEIYHPAPTIIKNGVEQWHVAAWNRSILEKLIAEKHKHSKKFIEFKILMFKQTKMTEIFFPRVLPELPPKQKQAFTVALERGYYTWPRKVDLSDLAKEMSISVATYQEHIRKAEAKLLPFFAENTKFGKE